MNILQLSYQEFKKWVSSRPIWILKIVTNKRLVCKGVKGQKELWQVQKKIVEPYYGKTHKDVKVI